MKQEDSVILIEKVLEQIASEDEFRTLESAIMSDPDVCQLYMDLARQHSLLKQTAAAGIVSPLSSDHVEEASSITQNPKNILPYKFGLAIASLVAVVAIGLALSRNPQDLPLGTHGSLTKSSSAQWGNCSIPTRLNDAFGPGELELLLGTAELTLDSGVTVQLEAPVRFEIIDDMKTFIHYGTAVADVPDGAEGFRMDAPDAEVTDYGTVFAVSVDQVGSSVVDVIEGEVEVYRPDQQFRERLKNNKNFREISRQSVLPKEQRNTLGLSAGKGRFGTVIANDVVTHLSENLLLVKLPANITSRYTRKAYLQFDLTKANLKNYSFLSLSLQQVRSPFGLASFVPECAFSVYMLKDEQPWPEELTWETAPASSHQTSLNGLDHEKLTKIGSFVIPEGQQEGSIEVELNQLGTNSLLSKESLTLIITRETKELSSQGLAHAFAAKNLLGMQEPQLIFHTSQEK